MRAGRRKRVSRRRRRYRLPQAERRSGRPPHAHSPLGQAAWLGRPAERDGRRAGVIAHARSALGAAPSPGLGRRRAHARRAKGARWQVSGRVAAGDGTIGAAAARAVRRRRPGTLLPHRRDREALLHRGDPRRDHGHRSGGAREDRALRVPQTRPRRPAECGSRPEQAGRDGSVCSAGKYRTQMWDKQKEVFLPSTPGLGMHVEVKDPEGKVGPPLVVLGPWHGRSEASASRELPGPCRVQRTGQRSGGGCHAVFRCRWCCPGSTALRAASPSPPTRPVTIRSACTRTPPGWLSLLVADW